MLATMIMPRIEDFRERVAGSPLRWAAIIALAAMLGGSVCGGAVCSAMASAPPPGAAETVTVEVPGPTQIVEVPGPTQIVEVPGPTQIVEVLATVEIPGPTQIVEVAGPVQVVEVPGPIQTVEIPGPTQIVEVPVTVAPPVGSESAGGFALEPSSGAPGIRVLLRWEAKPPLYEGAAWFNGKYLSSYGECELGLCGHPHVGVFTIPRTAAQPGPYLVGVGDGTRLFTAVYTVTAPAGE